MNVADALRQLHSTLLEVGVGLGFGDLGGLGIRVSFRPVQFEIGEHLLHAAKFGAVVVGRRLLCGGNRGRTEEQQREEAEPPVHRRAASAAGAVTASTRGLSSVPEMM